MKQNEISSLPKLKRENYENLFNVYETENGMFYYNLLQTIAFPISLPNAVFKYYEVVDGDTWPLISYKNYNTTGLWWVILYANNILNPIKKIEIGTSLKIPIEDVVQEILNAIGKQ